MSTSEWNEKLKSMRMQVYKQFVYKNSIVGNAGAFGAAPQSAGARYDCRFEGDPASDEAQSACNFDVTAIGGIAKEATKYTKKLWKSVDIGNILQEAETSSEIEHPMNLREIPEGHPAMAEWLKDKDTPPSEVWDRVTLLRNESDNIGYLRQWGLLPNRSEESIGGWHPGSSHHYHWIRIMDREGKIREESFQRGRGQLNRVRLGEGGFWPSKAAGIWVLWIVGSMIGERGHRIIIACLKTGALSKRR